MQFLPKGHKMPNSRILEIHPGDTVTLRKKHPCGADSFRVMRTGSDVRIVCLGCGHDMTLPREKLERAVKNITSVNT